MKEKNREGGRTQHRKHNRRDQQSENETGARTEEDWTVWTFVVRNIETLSNVWDVIKEFDLVIMWKVRF